MSKKIFFVILLCFLTGPRDDLVKIGPIHIGYLLLLLMCLLFFNDFLKSTKLIFKKNFPTLFFLLPLFVSFVSLLWTDNLIKGASEAITIFLIYYIGAIIAWRYSILDLLKMLRAVSMIVACTSLLLEIAPGNILGGDEPWTGIYVHKNALARYVSIGLLATMCLLFSGQKIIWNSVCIAFLSLVLLKTSSGTVIIAIVLIGLLLIYYKSAKNIEGASLLVGSGFLYPLFIGISVIPFVQYFTGGKMDFILEFLGRDTARSTLDVRYYLWDQVLQEFVQNKLIGHGIGGFWPEGGQEISVFGNQNLSWFVSQSHNGFIELYLQLGLLGLFTLFAYLWCQIRLTQKTVSLVKPGESFFLIFYMFIFLAFNTNYSAMFGQLTFPWLLLVILFLSMYKTKYTHHLSIRRHQLASANYSLQT